MILHCYREAFCLACAYSVFNIWSSLCSLLLDVDDWLLAVVFHYVFCALLERAIQMFLLEFFFCSQQVVLKLPSCCRANRVNPFLWGPSAVESHPKPMRRFQHLSRSCYSASRQATHFLNWRKIGRIATPCFSAKTAQELRKSMQKSENLENPLCSWHSNLSYSFSVNPNRRLICSASPEILSLSSPATPAVVFGSEAVMCETATIPSEWRANFRSKRGAGQKTEALYTSPASTNNAHPPSLLLRGSYQQNVDWHHVSWWDTVNVITPYSIANLKYVSWCKFCEQARTLTEFI